MAATKLLLHTDALIDFYSEKGEHRSVHAVLKSIEEGDFEGFISASTIMELSELMIHVNPKLCFQVINSLHTTFGENIVPINSRIAVESVQAKIKYGLETPDAVICATARRCDALLLTTNNSLIRSLAMGAGEISATTPSDFAKKAGLVKAAADSE